MSWRGCRGRWGSTSELSHPPRRPSRSWARCSRSAQAAAAAGCRNRRDASTPRRSPPDKVLSVRTALIADIHGNFVSLQAVLADAGRRGADRIVCLGDVAATGPQPLEAIEAIPALGCEVVQ